MLCPVHRSQRTYSAVSTSSSYHKVVQFYQRQICLRISTDHLYCRETRKTLHMNKTVAINIIIKFNVHLGDASFHAVKIFFFHRSSLTLLECFLVLE